MSFPKPLPLDLVLLKKVASDQRRGAVIDQELAEVRKQNHYFLVAHQALRGLRDLQPEPTLRELFGETMEATYLLASFRQDTVEQLLASVLAQRGDPKVEALIAKAKD